jgi:hypothetical protein
MRRAALEEAHMPRRKIFQWFWDVVILSKGRVGAALSFWPLQPQLEGVSTHQVQINKSRTCKQKCRVQYGTFLSAQDDLCNET